jgi:putative peptide zinc metalloprotease protein
METAKLKFRNDLLVSEQRSPEGTMFIIKDPSVDRFFRLKEIEHFIARQLDGETSLETIQERVEEKFDIALSTENIEQFTKHLHYIGVLTNGTDAPPTSLKKSRIAGDLFYFRFKLFNPDKLFDWILPRILFLFTPGFIVLSAITVLIAIFITYLNRAQIMHEFYGLFNFESLALAWFTILGVVTLHEFAHGLTCKYFGGHVREIGFMLIYFQPAFYCNVSDAWLFPEKSKRMWVTFAGGYFEIFIWAMATIIWRVTDSQTSLNHFALIVSATSAFKMFFNMNPLIKLDGYYLLSDWLDIPNLRQKASQYLNSRIKKLWNKRTNEAADIPPRERRILLTYALLSGVYIYWLLGSIALWSGSYLVDNYQAWGFFLYTSALVLFFKNPIKKTFTAMRSHEDNTTDGTIINEKKGKAAGWVKFAFFSATLLALLYFVRLDLKVTGSFIVMPQHNADVRAEVEGIIEHIYTTEGAFIEKGEPIARLSDFDYTAELRKVKAEIEAKQAQLKLTKAGTRQEEIKLARTQIAKAADRYNFGKTYFERDKQAYQQKLISQKEFEETRESFSLRAKELQEAKERLNVLVAGSRPEEIEALNADIRKLQSHEQYLLEQSQSLLITSPISGVVTTHKLSEKVGENVKKGDLIAEVFELKTVLVEIAVPEKEIGEVQVGQKVVLKARAHPGITFEGKINSIAPVAIKPDEWSPDRTVMVTTQLDNSAGKLKPEMTGHAKIYCDEKNLLALTTYRFVRYFRVEFWSWF